MVGLLAYATAAGLTTPAWIPIAVGGTALVLGYGTYRLLKLKKKVAKIPKGKEAQFTDTEAKIVEQLLRFMPNGGS
ncbi:MAG: hypothetical protein ABL919_16380 [Methylococcales bacterium]|nr:hypothetical protein [Methylococcaceae bacterium]